MKKEKLFFQFFICMFIGICSQNMHAQDRGLSVVARENIGPSVTLGKQYALFIAIDKYEHWGILNKPVADAKEIRDILLQDYFIDEVIELYDEAATKQNIMRTFAGLQSKLAVHDSLFIYYAGHGYFDKASNAGFWIPVNGVADVHDQTGWLPNTQVRGYISGMKATHVFMLNDCCFSGDILGTTRGASPEIRDNAYFQNAYNLTSRQVITAGDAKQEVPDNSEISAAFKICLQKNTHPLLDPNDIYNDIKRSVTKTTPVLGFLSETLHQAGSAFIFFRRSQSREVVQIEESILVESSQVSVKAATGHITVTSEVAGTVIIDGTDYASVKAYGPLTISNIAAGLTEISVRDEAGNIHKSPLAVMVNAGETVPVIVKKNVNVDENVGMDTPVFPQVPATISPSVSEDKQVSLSPSAQKTGVLVNNNSNVGKLASAKPTVDPFELDGKKVFALGASAIFFAGPGAVNGVDTQLTFFESYKDYGTFFWLPNSYFASFSYITENNNDSVNLMFMGVGALWKIRLGRAQRLILNFGFSVQYVDGEYSTILYKSGGSEVFEGSFGDFGLGFHTGLSFRLSRSISIDLNFIFKSGLSLLEVEGSYEYSGNTEYVNKDLIGATLGMTFWLPWG
ncbi:caspase family protein [Treponema sp. OttesenSCG-928-L16]|nr:caspase family protein [Treponema sp. OttesenSCG-928-L16]